MALAQLRSLLVGLLLLHAFLLQLQLQLAPCRLVL
jgi:hypothetical protein